MRAIGTDQVGIANVQSVGEEADCDALAGREILCLRHRSIGERGMGEFQALGLE